MHFPQTGESAADLWLERSLFSGVVLGAVFYGLHLAVFLVSTYFVIKTPATGKTSWPFLPLLICLFVAGTLHIAAQARFGELIWIDNRGFTGGPEKWYDSHYNDPMNVLRLSSLVFGTFIADGVLLYRLFVMWDKSVIVMIFPVLIYVASSALSALAVFQVAQPHSTKWSRAGVRFDLPYWVLTTVLNICITAALAFRLMKMRRAVIKNLGRDHAKLYTSVIAMIVESGAIYAVVGLACIIVFLSQSNVLNLVEPILAQVLCICPELIILRVIYGRSWARNMAQSTSARRAFAERPMAIVSDKELSASVLTSTVVSTSKGSTSEGSFESYVDF